MNYEKASREELVARLHELTVLQERSAQDRSETQRLIHELQVHQIELEMQNRELRDSRAALEESRSRYAELYDFAPVACCTLDGAGVVEELNLTAASLFGRSREHALGRPLTSLIRFDDPQSFSRHLRACAGKAEAVVSEFRVSLGDRSAHVEAVSVPVPSLAAASRAFRTAFTDITRRKEAEAQREAALASEQRLRTLLQTLDRAHVEAALALAKPGRAGLQEMMNVIVRHARRITAARTAHLELIQLAGQFGSLKTEFVDDHADAAQAEEVHALRACLRYGERVLAALQVTRPATDGPFTDQAQSALEALAERLASSLEIARLRTLDARETLRLSLLEGVDHKLRPSHEVEAIRRSVGDVAELLVQDVADLCLVHLARDTELVLERIAHADVEQPRELAAQLLRTNPEQVARGLAALARSSEPHLVRCARGAPVPLGSVQAELMDSIRLTSLIVAPLWARDRLLGTLCFGRVDFDEEYDGALLGWAREIAGRCASALDTAQLVRDLRDTLEWRKSLMAMISHDLRNPLSAIELSVRSLAPQTPHKERRSSRKQVDVIQRSATYMNHLLNDLQATSLLEAGAFHLELRHEHGLNWPKRPASWLSLCWRRARCTWSGNSPETCLTCLRIARPFSACSRTCSATLRNSPRRAAAFV